MRWLGQEAWWLCWSWLEVWFSSGLLKHLRAAEFDLAPLLTGWSNCTFPYLSGKRHMCKPCLYDIVFENKNKLSKHVPPKPNSRSQLAVRIPSLRKKLATF